MSSLLGSGSGRFANWRVESEGRRRKAEGFEEVVEPGDLRFWCYRRGLKYPAGVMVSRDLEWWKAG